MINFIIYLTFILTLINFITLCIFVYAGRQENLTTRKFNNVDIEGTLKVKGGDISNEEGIAHYVSQDENGAVIAGNGSINDFTFKNYDTNNNLQNVFLVETQSLNTTFNGDIICGNGTLNLSNGTTVTQISNKSNSVTVNDYIGRIVTTDDEMTSGELVNITVTNQLVGADDHIYLTLSGTEGENYIVKLLYVVNGEFKISLQNNTIFSRSESVKINFLLIRGSIN